MPRSPVEQARRLTVYRWIRNAAPYAFLLLSTIVFYREILFRTDTFIPWDLPGYHLPQAVLISKSLHAGHLPLWDPYTFCGRPFFEEIPAQVFYPFRIITLLLVNPEPHVGVLRALEVELVFHVFLAAVFSLWLARRMGLRGPATLLSATAYSLGCYFASQAEHIGAIEGAAWLPLAWLAVVLLHEKATFGRVALLAGALALLLLAGFTPAAILMFGSVGLLSLLYTVATRSGLRPLLLTGAAVALAVCLAAIQVVPTQQLSALSLGSSRANWRGTGDGIALAALPTILLPNYLGSFSWNTFQRQYEITLVYLYCGVIVTALALLALFIRPSRIKWILAVLLVIASVLMLGDKTPIGKAVFLSLPRFIRGPLYPQHWMAVFSLCVALLSGFGLGSLGHLRRWRYALVILAAVDLIAVSSARPMNTTRADPASIGLDQAVDGDRGALNDVRAVAKTSRPPSRIDVYRDGTNVWVTGAILTRIPTANGLDPLAPTRLLKVRELVGGAMWAYSPVNRVRVPILSALGVGYLMSRLPIDLSEHDSGVLRIFKVLPDRSLMYTNTLVSPRFYFVPRVMTTSDIHQSVEAMNRDDWKPALEAIVEDLPPPRGGFTPGEARVVSYGNERVLLRTQSSGRGFLASSEVNYPGWHALIDGQETPIYYTNGAFRGIVVPGGEHTVAFEFRPMILYLSALISLLAILGTIAGLLVSRKLGNRSHRAGAVSDLISTSQ